MVDLTMSSSREAVVDWVKTPENQKTMGAAAAGFGLGVLATGLAVRYGYAPHALTDFLSGSGSYHGFTPSYTY